MGKPNGQLFETHRMKAGHSQIVGYARVSTRDQSLASQLAQLRDAGCCRVVAEKCSSVGPRAGWAALMDQLRKGDTVAVVRLDRMGRHLGEVIQSVQLIHDAGGYVRSTMQGIDTRAASGRLMLPIWAALAETEREILRERTRAGLEAAREEGRRGGRPPKRDAAKDNLMRHLRAQGFSLAQIAKAVGVGSTTVRRALADAPLSDPRQLRFDVDTTAATAAAGAAVSR
jgi:DNA invertase Pin-like site-specific DNA recombinase